MEGVGEELEESEEESGGEEGEVLENLPELGTTMGCGTGEVLPSVCLAGKREGRLHSRCPSRST